MPVPLLRRSGSTDRRFGRQTDMVGSKGKILTGPRCEESSTTDMRQQNGKLYFANYKKKTPVQGMKMIMSII